MFVVKLNMPDLEENDDITIWIPLGMAIRIKRFKKTIHVLINNNIVDIKEQSTSITKLRIRERIKIA